MTRFGEEWWRALLRVTLTVATTLAVMAVGWAFVDIFTHHYGARRVWLMEAVLALCASWAALMVSLCVAYSLWNKRHPVDGGSTT